MSKTRLLAIIFCLISFVGFGQSVFKGTTLKTDHAYGTDTMWRYLISMPAGNGMSGLLLRGGADSAKIYVRLDTLHLRMNGKLKITPLITNNCLADTSLWKRGSGTSSLMDKRSTTSSGIRSYTSGWMANTTGDSSQAIGVFAFATDNRTQAIGYGAVSGGIKSQAIGEEAVSSATYATALGFKAQGVISKSTNISGAIFIRKSDGNANADAYQLMSGTEVLILSRIDTPTATGVITITLPSGVKFFPDEVGFIATAANTVTVQPTISYGVTGNNAALLAAAVTVGISAAGDRDRKQTLVTSDGQTSLTAEVTIGATATELVGRYYFKGFIVENQ